MRQYAFLADRAWLKAVMRDAFGRGFWGFFFLAVAVGAISYRANGADAFVEALVGDLTMILNILPRVMVALSVAALIWVMLPRNRVSALVGKDSGIGGLLVATVAGAVTPGGPSSAYALLAMLGASGAERGVLVAYITSWAMLGLQRVLLWDVPFMGTEFAIFRVAVCLPLPLVAGLIARKLPFDLTLRMQDAPPEQKAERA